MELLADGLLIFAALTAGVYCIVLARRLSSLKKMDSGLGGAIAGLSERVEITRASLAEMKSATETLTVKLEALTKRGEIAAARLELLLASADQAQDREDTAEVRKAELRRNAKESAAEKKRAQEQEILQALQKIAGSRG